MWINRDGSISHLINGKEVREHRVVFEQHYNCCLLPRTAIRHKNGIKSDNRIENLEPWSKRGRSAHFGRFAEPIPKNRRCMRCKSSKTKIDIVDGRPKPHWLRGHGDYEGGHLCDRCYHEIYRMEHPEPHRLLYEREGGDDGSECCITDWGQIHFINRDKTDIRIENMVLFRRGGSALLKKPRIPKDRRCVACGSPEGRGDWSKKPGGYICSSCRTNEVRSDVKRASTFEEERRIIELLQKMQSDPNFMSRPMGPRQCARCGSSTTAKRSRKKGGSPDWYRYGDKLDDLWQCKRCYDNQTKKPGKAAGLLMAWRKALKGVVVDPESYEQGERLWVEKKNALRRAKRRALKESMRRYVAPPQAPKRCAECGSTTTSKNVKGADNWYRLEVPIGPIGYLDNNCYRKRRGRLKAKAKANEIRSATTDV